MTALTEEEFENLTDDELAEFDAERQTGAGILSRIEHWLRRFVAYPSEHAAVAHTLWIAHCHLMACWESTPRIAFLSAERGSGKTRALEVTEPLVPNPVHAVNVTPAYLFRKVGDDEQPPTILYDEVDTVFHTKADTGEIRGLLNAGHRRGAVAGRCITVGNRVQTEEIPAYCAVALAGIGNLPDTIGSRSIIIEMRRRAPDEQVEPFRPKLHFGHAEQIARDMREWCADIGETMENAEPVLPANVQDRDADCWEPLLAIADAAGGDWPEMARAAAVALVAGAQERTVTTGVQLLSDLREVFGNAERLATETILDRLHKLPESAWADVRGKPLDSRGLAMRLRKYGVKPKVVRIGEETPRGYLAADLLDPWKRYLPTPEKAQQAQQAQHATSSATEKPAENCEKSHHVADVADVALIRGMGGNVADNGATADLEKPLTDAEDRQATIDEYIAILVDKGVSLEEAKRRARDELGFHGV